MNQQEVTAKIVVTVSLTNGKEIAHTYDLPSNDKGIEKLLDTIAGSIVEGLIRRTSFTLAFGTPFSFSVYNIDKVIGVRLSFVGSKELEERIAKLSKKKMGFLKD